MQMMGTHDKSEVWDMLCEYIRKGNAARLQFVIETYRNTTGSFLTEEYRPLRRGISQIDEEQKELKRQRRREIVAMRRFAP